MNVNSKKDTENTFKKNADFDVFIFIDLIPGEKWKTRKLHWKISRIFFPHLLAIYCKEVFIEAERTPEINNKIVKFDWSSLLSEINIHTFTHPPPTSLTSNLTSPHVLMNYVDLN